MISKVQSSQQKCLGYILYILYYLSICLSIDRSNLIYLSLSLSLYLPTKMWLYVLHPLSDLYGNTSFVWRNIYHYHPKSVWMLALLQYLSLGLLPKLIVTSASCRKRTNSEKKKKRKMDWCGTSHRLHQEDSRSAAGPFKGTYASRVP